MAEIAVSIDNWKNIRISKGNSNSFYCRKIIRTDLNKTCCTLIRNMFILFVKNNKIVSIANGSKHCHLVIRNKSTYIYSSSTYKFRYCLDSDNTASIEFSNSLSPIQPREKRIELLVKELLFCKRRKELQKAVKIYKKMRREKLVEFFPTDLCKIIEGYV